jgi:intracellular septation protein
VNIGTASTFGQITTTVVPASVAQIGWAYLRHRRAEPMLWVSLAVIVVFGGATLALRDETFIKWKPTVLYWLLSGGLLTSQTLFNKNMIEAMLREKLALPPRTWRNLSWGWSAFFAGLGAANLYVAFRFSTDAWVNFKLFGTTGLMFAFILVQAAVLSRHADAKETE